MKGEKLYKKENGSGCSSDMLSKNYRHIGKPVSV
jgi:hypothetical protein